MMFKALPGSCLALAAVACCSLVARPTVASCRIDLDAGYVTAGDKLTGKVVVEGGETTTAGSTLRVTLVRDIDVPAASGGKAGSTRTPLLEKVLPASAEPVSFPLAIDTAEMLSGGVRVQAAVWAPQATTPQSQSWSAPVEVGVRRRIDLAGPWQIKNVVPLDYESQWRPKEWKAPTFDKPIVLPGSLTPDEWFRGWVTLQREVSWPASGDRQPRVLCLSGVSNSALVSVDGRPVGETLPIDTLDVLTHWDEYHSPYKGPEKKQLRMQMLDVDVQAPSSLTLSQPLAKAGKSTVEMTIRGTHGMSRGKTPYGIFGELYFESTPAIYVESIDFDTEKPGPERRFHFSVKIRNDSPQPFRGKLRQVYGRYSGSLPYEGACPAYADVSAPLEVPPQSSRVVQVLRDETPRFDTCRAMFVILAADGKSLDSRSQDYHTVVVEVRDRRDLYLNNERFLIKGQGSWGEDPNSRLQLKLTGGNAFRSHRSVPSHRYPGLFSAADNINDRYRDGLLTSAGGALLASCEKCTFYDPHDTSNITRVVRRFMQDLAQCPGVIDWEATNELHGEPEEARVAILEAFHKLDPYHRPVLATKGSGEWEAEARDGRVAGVDIVGVQYLLSKEAVDSVTSAITEQPIMSTEVNWNDITLHQQGMWNTWLDKGLAGSLLFDYSGNSLQQPVPLVPPKDQDSTYATVRQTNRLMYQDLLVTARRQADGRILVTLGNRMPYALRQISLHVRELGAFEVPDLHSSDAATLLLPASFTPSERNPLAIRAEYVTHSGLKHLALFTPAIEAASDGGKSP